MRSLIAGFITCDSTFCRRLLTLSVEVQCVLWIGFIHSYMGYLVRKPKWTGIIALNSCCFQPFTMGAKMVAPQLLISHQRSEYSLETITEKKER